MKRSSVRLSVPSIDRSSGAGLLLSALRARDQSTTPGTQQQRRRSTALGSRCGQCHVDIRVDEAEHRLLFSYFHRALCGRDGPYGGDWCPLLEHCVGPRAR